MKDHTIEGLNQMIEAAQAEIKNRTMAIALSYQDLKTLVKMEYERNGKIPAIKRYRELTGDDLAEAKPIVEAWANYNKWFNPMP